MTTRKRAGRRARKRAAGAAATTSVTLPVVVASVPVSLAATCILDGLNQRHSLALAKRLGLEVDERLFTLEELRSASEVFTAGTSVELQPVVALVEPEQTTTWPIGPLTRQLMADFGTSIAASAATARAAEIRSKRWPINSSSSLSVVTERTSSAN